MNETRDKVRDFLVEHRRKHPRVRRPGDISKLVIPSKKSDINRLRPNDMMRFNAYGAWLLEEMSTADVVVKFCTFAKDRIEGGYLQDNTKTTKWTVQLNLRLEDEEYDQLCEMIMYWQAKKLKYESLYKAIDMTVSALRQIIIHRTSEANLTRKGYG